MQHTHTDQQTYTSTSSDPTQTYMCTQTHIYIQHTHADPTHTHIYVQRHRYTQHTHTDTTRNIRTHPYTRTQHRHTSTYNTHTRAQHIQHTYTSMHTETTRTHICTQRRIYIRKEKRYEDSYFIYHCRSRSLSHSFRDSTEF